MQVVTIRGLNFENPEELHDYLAQTLSFPPYYGKNLDALYDVLTDCCEDVRFVVDMEDMTDDAMLDYIGHVAEVIEHAARYNECLEIEYVER